MDNNKHLDLQMVDKKGQDSFSRMSVFRRISDNLDS